MAPWRHNFNDMLSSAIPDKFISKLCNLNFKKMMNYYLNIKLNLLNLFKVLSILMMISRHANNNPSMIATCNRQITFTNYENSTHTHKMYNWTCSMWRLIILDSWSVNNIPALSLLIGTKRLKYKTYKHLIS